MSNIALTKRIEEQIGNPQAATDGNTIDYDPRSGFAFFPWPGTLTVDLESELPIRCVRLLLWDGLGTRSKTRASRTYRYRLLVSSDHNTWRVLFDTWREGTLGWQVFDIPDTVVARYVRIHGLWNSANEEFHVVQLEVHDDTPPLLEADTILERTILPRELNIENGDSTPVSQRVNDIIIGVNELVNSTRLLNPAPFKDLMSQLRIQVRDISAIEQSIDSVRREIISPVKIELEKGSRLGRYSVWGFWVGIVGGVLAICSILQNLLAK